MIRRQVVMSGWDTASAVSQLSPEIPVTDGAYAERRRRVDSQVAVKPLGRLSTSLRSTNFSTRRERVTVSKRTRKRKARRKKRANHGKRPP
jgi:hypothetical protein